MRRLLSFLVVLAALVAWTAGPASAITGNYVKDVEHPFVGLVVFHDETRTFSHRCSGSLLTPTLFLTAGHCAAGARTARVYFQQDAGVKYDPATGVDPVTGYPETCAPGTQGISCATSDQLYNYGFDDFASSPNTHDVGLVILDQPIWLSEYGALAAPSSLDRLAMRRGQQEITFTASGYGFSKSSPVSDTSFRERLMAQAILTNLRSALTGGFNVQTTGNGSGRGGTCSGDSGGPVFYGGYSSNTIAAVTSFGLNDYCRGNDYAYRTDQAAVLAWIRSIVGVDEFSKIAVVAI